jgi:hypothetical protein
MRFIPPSVIAAMEERKLGTPTLLELKAKVEAAGYQFGKIIKGEYVAMYPSGYTGEDGKEHSCWMTWHATKTEKATHIPKNFDTETFKPLDEADLSRLPENSILHRSKNLV